MPKRNITLMQLPMEQPDCCASCPLVGIIPKEQRPRNSKESHVCLGTCEALSGRGIHVRASERDTSHKLHRPCDHVWEAWMNLPGRKLGINSNFYLTYRLPYEQSSQMVIKFHTKDNEG